MLLLCKLLFSFISVAYGSACQRFIMAEGIGQCLINQLKEFSLSLHALYQPISSSIFSNEGFSIYFLYNNRNSISNL
jgi:hypothetical protein